MSRVQEDPEFLEIFNTPLKRLLFEFRVVASRFEGYQDSQDLDEILKTLDDLMILRHKLMELEFPHLLEKEESE